MLPGLFGGIGVPAATGPVCSKGCSALRGVCVPMATWKLLEHDQHWPWVFEKKAYYYYYCYYYYYYTSELLFAG